MAINFGDQVMVSMWGRCFGQRIILTHTYVCTTPVPIQQPYVDEMIDILDAVSPLGGSNWMTPYLACLPTSYTLTEVRAQLFERARFAYVARALSSPGTHASPATVANDSAALTFRTEMAGRKQVATKHIGPVPDAVSALGLLLVPYKNLLTTLGQTMLQSITTATTGNLYEPCISHKVPDGSYDLMKDIRIGEQSRVQRRRTVGLGE